jgi:hypothetical protein
MADATGWTDFLISIYLKDIFMVSVAKLEGSL